MKKITISLFLLLSLVGCYHDYNDNQIEMHKLCVDYIDYLENKFFIEKNHRNKKLIIKIVEEKSKNNQYCALRISAKPPYLNEDEVPDKLMKIDGYLILVRFSEQSDSSNLINIKRNLSDMALFSDTALMITSNYPEWILLKDRKKLTSTLIKDKWYESLDSLIMKYHPTRMK
jgi:hypothetical protein